MTADRPDAHELIEIARAALNAEILPLLPDDRRLTGLMIANALAIASRELSAPRAGVSDVTATDIRSGGRDSDSALHAALLDDARARVAATNPKYLDDIAGR